jgi:hypothetical protein
VLIELMRELAEAENEASKKIGSNDLNTCLAPVLAGAPVGRFSIPGFHRNLESNGGSRIAQYLGTALLWPRWRDILFFSRMSKIIFIK